MMLRIIILKNQQSEPTPRQTQMEHLQSETGLNGHSDFRFVVGQEVCNTDRITIFVFDKVHQHVVYLAKTKNDEVHVQKEYDYIKDFYGKDNCKKPVDAKLSTYQ